MEHNEHEDHEIRFTAEVARKLLVAVLSSAIAFLGGWFWHISSVVEQHGHDLADVRPAIEELRDVQREVAVIRQIQTQEQQLINEIRTDLREIYQRRGERTP